MTTKVLVALLFLFCVTSATGFGEIANEITVVGSLQQIGNYPLTDGGAVSLDPDLNVLWIRHFDNLPVGAVASWNAIAYDADGEALLLGTGSDGRTGCDQTPCPVSVIGRFCAPTTP
jgi:hypothetical protein